MSVTDTLNAGEQIYALGRTWRLSHVTPGIRGKFSAWAKLKARQSVFGDKQSLPADQYGDIVDDLTASVDGGEWDWNSPLSVDGLGRGTRALLSTEDGSLKLLQLLLERHHGEVSAQTTADVMRQARDQVEAVLPLCLGLSEKNEPAPTTRRPVALALRG